MPPYARDPLALATGRDLSRMTQIRRRHYEDLREPLEIHFLDGAIHKSRMPPMEKASPANAVPVVEPIKETPTMVMEPSKGHPSLLGEASSFLIALGVRAAQNYAVYCLDDWIAPSQVLMARKPGLSPSSDQSTLPEGRHIRRKRVIGGCENQEPVLVDGGSEDDRSSP